MTLDEFKKKYQPAVSDTADEFVNKLKAAKTYSYSENSLRYKSIREWEKDCIEHLFKRLIEWGNTVINSTVWDKMLGIDLNPKKDIAKVIKHMTKSKKVTVNIKTSSIYTISVVGAKKSKDVNLVYIEVKSYGV